MDVVPSFPAGVKFVPGCGGFHSCDYPKGYDQLVKDYGLEEHDSTRDDSEYNRNPDYAKEMSGGKL
jgi:hypothetical protein